MASVTLVPSGYTGLTNATIDSGNPITNAYTNADSTSYARLNLTQSRTAEIYLTFDASAIPAGATITSVTARGKARVSSTTRVTNTSMQLYAGTTVKGSGTAFGSTTASTRALSPGTGWTRSDLTGLRLRVAGTASSSSSSRRIDFYGADVTVEYTTGTVHVTGVTLDKDTDTIEAGETTALTATVSPSDATDKPVTWATSNAAVATVSGGVVTGVGAGTARITATTTDGGYTAYCDVTVTPAVTYDFFPATEMEPGKDYLIATGNSGSVYLLTDEAGGSRTIVGVSATVANGKLTISGATKARTLFSCMRYTAGNDNTITVEKDGAFLYCDNANGLRMNTPATLDRFWHYRNNKLWQFKSTTADGYDDTSTEYKYYLQLSGGNFTDNHVTSPSIEDSDIPLVYLFTDTAPAPVITVGTPTRTIISDESGYDQCVCTFSSDLALQAWEARATKSGVTPARGVGLLVESGGSLAAGATGTIIVDDEELTQGDGDYTITVYGQSTVGVWSE